MPSVSIRIDDVDSQTSVSGLELLHQCLENCGGTCELSIIPFRHDDTGKWLQSLLKFIQDKPRFFLSLHGHSHIKRTDVSEFFGLSKDHQHKLISEGVDLLSSSDRFIKKFVPPWNSYDKNTLIACAALGIEVVGTSYKQYISTNSKIKIECISLDFQELLSLPKFYDLYLNKWHANLMCHTYDFKELHELGKDSITNFFEILTKRKIELTSYSDINLKKLYDFKFMRKTRKKIPNKLTPGVMKIGRRIQ